MNYKHHAKIDRSIREMGEKISRNKKAKEYRKEVSMLATILMLRDVGHQGHYDAINDAIDIIEKTKETLKGK